jgi:hypothetical protein
VHTTASKRAANGENFVTSAGPMWLRLRRIPESSGLLLSLPDCGLQGGSPMDTRRIHPEMLAGDGFAYSGAQRPEERPRGCIGGWVYLGFEGTLRRR